jgi:hypothetical protein
MKKPAKVNGTKILKSKTSELRKSIDEKLERDRLFKQAKEVIETEFKNLPIPKFSTCIDEQCLKVFLLQTPAKDFQTTSANL